MTVTKEYRHGREIRIPDYNGEIPDGKAFHAWNTRADGTGAVYKVGKKVPLVENLHLYPMFTDANANDSLEDDTEEAEE